MKKRTKLGVVVLGLMAALPVSAQTLSELTSLVQMSKAVLGNNASIDQDNPETVSFQTALDGQLVELNLKANRLNDTFVSIINYSPTMRTRPKARLGEMSSSLITFGEMHVILDGCDITATALAQCNTNGCWDTNPTTALTSFTGTFGTHTYLNLSALNPATISGCTAAAGQTSFFDAAHTTHTLQFTENMVNSGRGGSLYYQVLVYNKAY